MEGFENQVKNNNNDDDDDDDNKTEQQKHKNGDRVGRTKEVKWRKNTQRGKMYLFAVLKPKDWKHDSTFDRMSNENYYMIAFENDDDE